MLLLSSGKKELVLEGYWVVGLWEEQGVPGVCRGGAVSQTLESRHGHGQNYGEGERGGDRWRPDLCEAAWLLDFSEKEPERPGPESGLDSGGRRLPPGNAPEHCGRSIGTGCNNSRLL